MSAHRAEDMATSHGESIGQRLSWRQVFRYEWDRVGFHFCSMIFGVWAIWLTLSRPVPGASMWLLALSLIFDASFLMVGAFLFVALRNGSYAMRVQGYLIYVGALVLLAILIFAINPSPYGLLALAFAFQGLNAIREMREKHRVIVRVAEIVANDPYRDRL